VRRGSPLACVWLFSAAFLNLTSVSLPSSAQESPTLPRRWVGARFDDGRIGVSLGNTGNAPKAIVTESAPHRSRDALTVTDVALDVGRDVIYVATCCEPGSGQLRRVDLQAGSPVLASDDQGFAIDVAGPTSTIARTDTFGTLALRSSPNSQQDVRAQAGVSDVAVDATAGVRVIALIQPARLRALIPTVPPHEPGILVLTSNAGRWQEMRYSLSENTTYCRAVALTGGFIGLLAGQVDASNPVACTGDRLDVYDTTKRQLRAGAIRFPAPIRHLSVDDSSTYLIATTVDGAVRWRTLAGEAGDLAPRGFVAADW